MLILARGFVMNKEVILCTEVHIGVYILCGISLVRMIRKRKLQNDFNILTLSQFLWGKVQQKPIKAICNISDIRKDESIHISFSLIMTTITIIS
jgi:hypothetical protein